MKHLSITRLLITFFCSLLLIFGHLFAGSSSEDGTLRLASVENITEVGPVAVCVAEVNVSVGTNCEVTLTPAMIDAGSYDADGDPLTFSLDNPGPYSLGVYTVILNVSDGSSTNQCWSTVTVEDKMGPTAVCVSNVNVSLGADGTTTVLPEYIDAGSVDNCTLNLSIGSGPTAFDCSHVGQTFTLTLTVEDPGGNSNSCTSQVSIFDVGGFCSNESPLAVCVSNLNVAVDESCEAAVLPAYLDAGSFDPDGDPLTYSISPSGPFPPGIYTVTLMVSDGALTNSCFSQLTVLAPDNDGDGFSSCDGDCDDSNNTIYPGAPERCDGLDNDCDNSIDEPTTVNSTNIWAQAVALNTLNNISGNNGGYADFTAMSTTLNTATNYTITLTPGVMGYTKKLKWRVYIDLDQDGEFSNGAEKMVQVQGFASQSANFVIPGGTPSGPTRMRVIVGSKFEPGCSDNFNGEMEDYTVNIASTTGLVASEQSGLIVEQGQNNISKDATSMAVQRAELTLAPNPAKDVVSVKVKQLSENAELTIMDQIGRVVWSQTWNMDQQTLTLDLLNLGLVNGVYFVSLQTTTEKIVKRLVITQ